MFVSPFLMAQVHKIDGIVRDATTSEPLGFAHIQIDGSSQGTATDADGRFTMAVPAGAHILRCSYVGYRSDSLALPLREDTRVSFRLVAIDVLLQDVTVYAHRTDNPEEKEVSVLSLQSQSIKAITSTMPDVLRAIQMLPGVSANNEFSAKYNVRGGNQDENLVLVNDTKVYEPYHVKEASNASIGVFDVAMINKMDLIAGGFPARYGDRMSSVLNIEYREGSRDRFHGEGSISMTDVDALVEGPMGDNGSLILGARKSYFEYVLNMLNFEKTIHPSFYDVQGVLGYSIAPQSKILLKFIHAGDQFTDDPHISLYGPYQWTSRDGYGNQFLNTQHSSDSSAQHSEYYSNMFALQSVNILSSSAILKSEISLYDQSDREHSWGFQDYHYTGTGPVNVFYNYGNQRLYDNALRIRTWEFSSSMDLQASARYGVKTGASYQRISYHQDQVNQNVIDEIGNTATYPDTTRSRRVENGVDSINAHIRAQSYKLAGYVENLLQISDELLVNIGGRLDYFDFDRDLRVSPRVNLAFQAGAGVTVRAAWGYYYQSPIYSQLISSSPSDTNTHSQRAIQYVLGVDYDVIPRNERGEFLKLKVEGYHKDYDHLINAWTSASGRVYYSRLNDALGRANGVDLSFTYSVGDFYGWVSYGFLNVQQKMLNDSVGWFPRYTDQRHTLAAVASITLGASWDANVRFAYGSGYPFTPSVAVFDRALGVWQWVMGKVNSDRLPAYRRLDFRLTKSFSLFGGNASAFLDVSNLFNWENVQSYQYRFDSQGRPWVETEKLWPILPTLGLTVSF